MNKDTLELIQRLADAPGASGFEEAVVQAAREHLQELEGKLERTLELIKALQ